MRYFHGVRSPRECAVSVQDADQCKALDPRFDLRKHSPEGFNWGYGGSGPAQLSLALCAAVLKDDAKALAIYQDFKATVVCFLRGNTWMLDESKLLAVCNRLLEKEQAQRRLLELQADQDLKNAEEGVVDEI